MSGRGGRGRGGKYSKPKRGGGKHFSRDLQPVGANGEVENMWASKNKKRDEEPDEDSSEDEDSDEDDEDDEDDDEDDDDDEDSDSQEKQPATREERKAVAKARKEAAMAKKLGRPKPGDLPSDSEESDEVDETLPANPNHSAAAQKQASNVPAKAQAEDARPVPKKGKEQLSRREREALQAQQAKERYQKLHAEGKTDEARADLERLKLVRERREAEAARKKAEAEERALIEKEKTEQSAREERMRAAAAGNAARSGKKKK